jgi:hypothetical protein
MRIKIWGLGLGLIAAMCSFPLTGLAQQGASTEKTLAAPATTAGPVPQLINYAGVLTNVNGKPLTGVIGVTFLLYKDQQGGSPRWMETQNVQPDKSGHYSVMLARWVARECQARQTPALPSWGLTMGISALPCSRTMGQSTVTIQSSLQLLPYGAASA